MTLHTWIGYFSEVVTGVIAVGGTGAVVSYGIFQWLGKSWLDQHFRRQLEELRHEQQKEIEQVRYQINSTFSRVSKIHDKEFEVLPHAWELLHKAHGSTFHLASSFKRTPDLDRMPGPEFDAFLSACRLPDYAKVELRGAEIGNRNQKYNESIFWVELTTAARARTELNNYLTLNSIFMTDDLRQKFSKINLALAEVLVDVEITHEHPNGEISMKMSKKVAEISTMFGEIESAVQKRLRYEEA
jgi:hypothetical protein